MTPLDYSIRRRVRRLEEVAGGTYLSAFTHSDLTLTTGFQFWTFQQPPGQIAGADVTLDPDLQTININTDGLYTLAVTMAVQATDSRVKQMVSFFLSTGQMDADNLLRGSALAESFFVDASVIDSFNTIYRFLSSPPVPFLAGEKFKLESTVIKAPGQVGDVQLERINSSLIAVRVG